jgi:hypothetical protein
MSDLFIWIYSSGVGREVHETSQGDTSHKSLGTSVLAIEVKAKQSRYTPWRRLGGEEI